ncbi:MAG TPA: isocitrate lyase/phosphoenolpyruvate mutase family protein [Nitrososphaerales archaeon]|nr:isocitrate lyase/phosphoenolpyruvate mutase family protein [Nitrososphaerales archaeon]
MSSQAEKAELFRSLHRGGRILVLPNAWDVPSARVFEDSGFKAVATSSAGMMVSLGYQDGEAIPRREFMQGVKRIAGALGVPLSADVVAGFGGGPAGVERTVKEVVKAGAVGINIEDFVHLTKTLMPLEEQVRKLKSLVKLRDSSKVRFVINARTDAFRFGKGGEEERLEEAIRRGKAYRDLGADCVYPMGLVDSASISEFVRALGFPVNVMVRKGLPPVRELEGLGVARVSFGPSASYAAMGLLRRASEEVMKEGTYSLLTEGAVSFDELNSLAVPKKP